jgi:hypothetical protein
VAEEHDVGLRFLGFTEASVLIPVQQAKDSFVRFFSMPVFKDLDVHPIRTSTPQTLGQLHRPVMRIVVMHKAACESHENIVDLFGELGLDRPVSGQHRKGQGT